MSFTIADAITRITNEPEPVWTPGMTSGQYLQRINSVLERFYAVGSWDGLLQDVTVTTTGGIISLASNYSTIESLRESVSGSSVSIKSQQWKYTPSAPPIGDWTKYRGRWLAFDLGEISGARQYEIPGGPDYVDTKTFKGMARLRYVWATSTTTVVIPDCFQALLVGVRAFHWYDVGDNQRGDAEFQNALALLESTLEEVIGDEDMGNITLDPETSGGSILNLV